MLRKLAWTAFAFAVLFGVASALAPPSGGRPGGSGRPSGLGARPGVGIGGVTAKAAKADFAHEFNTLRARSNADAAKMLREEGPSKLSRPERAALLNGIVYQIARRPLPNANDRLGVLRQLRADWNAIGPVAGLDPLVEMELAAAEAAAERAALSRALGLIREKQYAKAAEELTPLMESRHLPVSIAKAIPELRKSLAEYSQLISLRFDAELPPSQTRDLPTEVQQAILGVELLVKGQKFFANPQTITLVDAKSWLNNVSRTATPEIASKLRVELSASAFLADKSGLAVALLEDDLDGDHGRAVLAELRQVVLGGGTISNAQVARLATTEKMPPGVAHLVTPDQRAKWKAPTAANGVESTIAKFETLARKKVVELVTRETQIRAGKIPALAATIMEELAKQAGPIGAFVEKVQTRLGRPVDKAEETELVAFAAAQGLTVDEVATLLCAEADAPARAARLLGVVFASGCVADIVIAAGTSVSLKPGDGAFKLPADVQARNRAKVREAVRAVFNDKPRPKTRAAFEGAVVKLLELKDGESLTPAEFVQALLDVTRDSAVFFAAVDAETRDLSEALHAAESTEPSSPFDDPPDMATVAAAKTRLNGLLTASIRHESEVQFGCEMLPEYGADAFVALPWLRDESNGSASWRDAAISAVNRLTPKPAK